MALNINAVLPNATAASPQYPQGGAKDASSPSATDGTAHIASTRNDIFGLQQAILAMAGITPSGNSDNAEDAPLNSQYLSGLLQIQSFADVRGFGAVGDGVADDTVAVQAALDAASGSGVSLPPGTYLCTQLTIGDNTILIGLGGTLKLKNGSDTSLLTTAVGASNILIQKLRIEGNQANNTGTPVTQGVVEIKSSFASPSTNVRIDQCVIENSYRYAITLGESCAGVEITYNIIDDTETLAGIGLTPAGVNASSDILVRNNRILNPNTSGIISLGILTNSDIVGNYIDNAGSVSGDNITANLEGNFGLTIRDNYCLNSNVHGIFAAGGHVTIAGNTISDHDDDGIRLQSPAAGTAVNGLCAITGNTINWTSTGSGTGIYAENAQGVAISGNTLGFEADPVPIFRDFGIQIVQAGANLISSDHYSVVGNTIIGIEVYGINVEKAASRGVISGNTIVGDATGGSTGIGIRLNGTGTLALNNTLVTSNNIRYTRTNAILELASADNNLIHGNMLGSFTISTVGGGTVVSDNLTGTF